MPRSEAIEMAPFAVGPTPVRYIATATVYRRATNAEIDRLEAWLDNNATPDQCAKWRDAAGGLMRVDEVLPLATRVFGVERAAELLD
jgi:hypothetical protein